jgi:hypothetical protein
VSDKTAEEVKNVLEKEAPANPPAATAAREPDPPTVARGVLEWTGADPVVVKAASGHNLKDYSVDHMVRGAHAEEHVTLFVRNDVRDKFPAEPAKAQSASLRYEINRSPCVNCANYLADFTRHLRSRSDEATVTVAASALYEGAAVFTGEIRNRYRRIFDKIVKEGAVQERAEFEAAMKKKAEARAAKAQAAGKAAPKGKGADDYKAFSGVRRTKAAVATEAARREEEWAKVTIPQDRRKEWFRIRPMEDHGKAGLAILRAHGIGIEALTADAALRPLTPQEEAVLNQEDLAARAAFLTMLKKKNAELLEKLADVDAKMQAEEEKDEEKLDRWIVDDGYAGPKF